MSSKDERITLKIVMRAAIQVLFDEFGPQRGDSANIEDELLTFAKTRPYKK